MGAYSYSGTAASNTSIDGIGAAGTNSPANLDDLHRAQAAALANFVRDLGGANTLAGTDTLTISLADATTLTAYFDGMLVGGIVANDNTSTTPTLNVDSVGAKFIKKASAGVESDLAAGDLQAGAYVLFRYRSSWASSAGAWELIRFDTSLPQSLSTADSPTFVDVTTTDDVIVGDDILLGSGGVINWNSGDVTLTHSSNFMTWAGGSIGYYQSIGATTPSVYYANQTDNASVKVAVFEGDRATPTDGDAAYFDMQLSDSGGTQTVIARQKWTGVDITDTTEDGSITWSVVKAGTLTDVMTLDSTGLSFSNGAAVATSTLLGTITTTSGATQSLGSLTLTGYKFLRLVVNGVSHDNGSNRFLTLDSIRISNQEGAADAFKGIVDLDLTTGIAIANIGITSGSDATTYMADTAYTTATTSITVGISGGAFDAGEIKVYGIA